jgi:hypothetical protein
VAPFESIQPHSATPPVVGCVNHPAIMVKLSGRVQKLPYVQPLVFYSFYTFLPHSSYSHIRGIGKVSNMPVDYSKWVSGLGPQTYHTTDTTARMRWSSVTTLISRYIRMSTNDHSSVRSRIRSIKRDSTGSYRSKLTSTSVWSMMA